MNHSVILKNADRILRPVSVDDAEFIVYLRNLPHVKGRINDTSVDIEKQREWIIQYLARPNEWYWIVESVDHKPLGTTSLYHYDSAKKQIEIGRWAMVKDHGINLIASRVQILDFAFDSIGVDRVVCDVASYNKSVLRYHRLLGEQETGVEKGAFVIEGQSVDMVWFLQTKADWPRNRERQLRLAR